MVDQATPGSNSTADRMLDVLLLFDLEHPVLSAVEVSRQLGMPRSTTYRYLQSLRSYGLVEEDTARGAFRLGPRIFTLARVARQGLGLTDVAVPAMQQLAETTGEAVLLTRRSGAQVVCVERVDPRAQQHPLRLSYERGHVLPAYAGASATVLLAFEEDAEVESILATLVRTLGEANGHGSPTLPRYTERTVTDLKKLRAKLREIRAAGYAVSDGEVDFGIRGIAAPILGRDSRVIAGLSVAGPAYRLTDAVLGGTIAAVQAHAETISQRLSETEI